MDCEAFVPPPEAPVYEPTDEQFKDPITYIASIRPVAEKFGICRIKPPSHWQPPFAPDPDTYKFTPRIQKLNELEAKSRIKLHFLNHLTKFWHLQHNPLKIPFIENKHLDLYHLRKFVHERDGFHKVTHDFKWKEVAQQLGYSTTPEIANSLKNYYFKLLLPYDVFIAGTPDLNVQKIDKTKHKVDVDTKKEVSKMAEVENVHTKMEHSEADGSNKHGNTSSSIDVDASKCNSLKLENELSGKKKCHELKKLQFYGPGPKTALPDAMPIGDIYDNLANSIASCKRTRPKSKDGKLSDSSAFNMCMSCGEACHSSECVCCSVCAGLFHHACLILPLRESARKSWRCPFCIAKECKRPMPSFGFEQSQCEYSLKTYGLMADKFKSDYFKMSCHLVPCLVVEQEFWRLVNCLEKDVVVEYGADIHTLEFGSGFPTVKNQHLIEDEDRIYITSPWNLNNLPNLEHSLLKYINVDINGMKVPWVYVGMCFSSFAWHIEDHWSYSVNYMHWGEPKTWYGVPGSSASHLEDCMSKNAPELFAQFPDLLHQLTTIMNPTLLQKSGVPIYRTDQHAGEFVITFPRSYHSGFNQGYNCAEAVNFCTADWLPFGHGCIENYRLHKRQCVFSNDEFVFNILAHVNELAQECLYALYQILVDIVRKEKEMREQVKQEGITLSQQESFELLSDDDRQCEYCKTTCFLSAVTCDCTPRRMVCLHHINSLCSSCLTSSFRLLYKYTMEQLNENVDHLQTQLHGFKSWIIKAKIAMEAKGRDRLALSSMQCILREARENNFPSCPTLEALKRECEFGERCQTVACMLLGPDGNLVNRRKVKRRRSKRKKGVAADDDDNYDDEEDVLAGEVDSKLEDKEKVSYEEFMTIVNRMDRLSFKLMCAPKLKELSIRIEKFRKKLQADIQKHPLDNELIDSYFDQCYEYPVEVPELAMLHQSLFLISWLEEVSCIQNETIRISCDTVLRLHETGLSFATSDPKIESSLEFLKELISTFKKLEFKAATYTFNKPWQSVEDVERLVIECQESKMVIPSIGLLSSALKDAKEWCSAAEEMFPKLFKTNTAPVTRRRSMLMLSGSNDESVVKPKLEDLNNLISKSQQIPISLPQLENIINIKSQVTGWIAQLSQMLLKSSQQSLLEMLLPRKDIPSLVHKSTKCLNSSTKTNNRNSCADSNNEDDDGFSSLDYSSFLLGFPHLEDEYLEISRKAEIADMQILRQVNEKKMNASPCGSIGHCICGLGKYGSMVQCSLCCELYHYGCVEYSCISQPLPFPLLSPFDILKTFDNFLCPRCNRTNRQRVSELNNFVAMYNNDLEVDFREGLALCNLMKRAEEWKLKMKAFIKAKPDLKVLENLWKMLANGDDIGNLNDKFLLTKNMQESLMELLLEGDLIEVHMSERYLIRYALHCHDASTFKTRIYAFPDVLPDVIKTLPRKTSHPRKRNKRCSRDGPKIQDKLTNLEQTNVVSNSESVCSVSQVDSSNADGENDDEPCSADCCVRPKDEEIEWIQCDICQRWFHFVCIGLQRNDVSDEVEFVCKSCTRQPCDVIIKGCYSLACATDTNGRSHQNEEPLAKKKKRIRSSTVRTFIKRQPNRQVSSLSATQYTSSLLPPTSSLLLSYSLPSSLSLSLSPSIASSSSSPPFQSPSSSVLLTFQKGKLLKKIIVNKDRLNNNNVGGGADQKPFVITPEEPSYHSERIGSLTCMTMAPKTKCEVKEENKNHLEVQEPLTIINLDSDDDDNVDDCSVKWNCSIVDSLNENASDVIICDDDGSYIVRSSADNDVNSNETMSASLDNNASACDESMDDFDNNSANLVNAYENGDVNLHYADDGINNDDHTASNNNDNNIDDSYINNDNDDNNTNINNNEHSSLFCEVIIVDD